VKGAVKCRKAPVGEENPVEEEYAGEGLSGMSRGVSGDVIGTKTTEQSAFTGGEGRSSTLRLDSDIENPL